MGQASSHIKNTLLILNFDFVCQWVKQEMKQRTSVHFKPGSTSNATEFVSMRAKRQCRSMARVVEVRKEAITELL